MPVERRKTYADQDSFVYVEFSENEWSISTITVRHLLAHASSYVLSSFHDSPNFLKGYENWKWNDLSNTLIGYETFLFRATHEGAQRLE